MRLACAALGLGYMGTRSPLRRCGKTQPWKPLGLEREAALKAVNDRVTRIAGVGHER